jgi:hypothetical protein
VAPPRNSVRIERLVVEGGFLDGLDLGFSSGLNVLIGERGAGKTSIIELLRFAFGTAALTERFNRAAREHTASVLGEGRVSVGYVSDGERRMVSRRIGDEKPEGDMLPPEWAPIVLSQNEVEAVGLDERGRLRLIDGFLGSGGSQARAPSKLLTAIASVSSEIKELSDQVETLRDRTAERQTVEAKLAEAEDDLAQTEANAAQVTTRLPELNSLAARATRHRVSAEALGRAVAEIRDWSAALSAVVQRAPDVSTDGALGDTGERVSVAVADASREVEDAARRLEQEVLKAEDTLEEHRKAQHALDVRARELRLELERVQSGAGAAIRRVTDLREQVAQLQAVSERLAHLETRRGEKQAERARLLDDLEDHRASVHARRQAIAASLSTSLGPRIRVAIERGGVRHDYRNAIVNLLKGSGLRYGQLAPALATQVSAPDLVDAIERGDDVALRTALDLTPDRARRLTVALADSDLGPLLTAEIDDSVILMLFDGNDYKPTPMLSTGQRCTVVLPILLGHDERVLVMDQPEDHLDNAYVVDTLVRAIGRRGPDSQLIVSTHNPNVPVLGNAERVTLLGSDGRRGFQRFSGPLDSPRVVDAITTIMEGGAEAFRQRAVFYENVHRDDDA